MTRPARRSGFSQDCFACHVPPNSYFAVCIPLGNMIQSDLGQNLQGKIISNLLDILKISRLKTSPYHPQSNGASECSFRSIHQILTKYISENPSNYANLLPLLAYALNTAENSTTKVSPFFLMRGFQPRHLTGIYYGLTTTNFYRNQQHCASELYKQIAKVYSFVIKNVNNAQMSASEYWNQKLNYVKYVEGQKVYFFQPVGNVSHRKIRSPFHKAVIVKAYATDVYLIKLEKNAKTFICSYDKLTLIPAHITEGNPRVQGSDNEDSDIEIDDPVESSEDELERELVEDTTEQQPIIDREIPRRSSRVRKPVEHYDSKW